MFYTLTKFSGPHGLEASPLTTRPAGQPVGHLQTGKGITMQDDNVSRNSIWETIILLKHPIYSNILLKFISSVDEMFIFIYNLKIKIL